MRGWGMRRSGYARALTSSRAYLLGLASAVTSRHPSCARKDLAYALWICASSNAADISRCVRTARSPRGEMVARGSSARVRELFLGLGSVAFNVIGGGAECGGVFVEHAQSSVAAPTQNLAYGKGGVIVICRSATLTLAIGF